MKKALLIMLALAVAVCFTTPVNATMEETGDHIKAGLEKIIKSPLNVPDHVKEEYNNNDFKPFAVFGGLLKGLFYTAYDFGHGAVDVVTSPVHLLPK